MYRVTAFALLGIGLGAIALAAVANFHLRSLAATSGPVSLNVYIDIRLLIIGVQDKSMSDAATFCNTLQTRIQLLFGAGAILVITGSGAWLWQSSITGAIRSQQCTNAA